MAQVVDQNSKKKGSWTAAAKYSKYACCIILGMKSQAIRSSTVCFLAWSIITKLYQGWLAV